MSNYPLTLLYDGGCAVCSLEIDLLRRRDRDGRLAFVDIASPGFDAAAWGATPAALDAEIHGVYADGSVVRGMETLRGAYRAVGLGPLVGAMAGATAWPAIKPLADHAYRLFARHRRTVSRWLAPLLEAAHRLRARRLAQRMARCRDGLCRIDPVAANTERRSES